MSPDASRQPAGRAEVRWGSAEIGPARVYWTDRHGGVSPAPRDTLNLGHGRGDPPDVVEENRRRVAAAIGLPLPWLWLRQVHGREVAVARRQPTPGAAAPEADAAVTRVPRLVLPVLAADCAPVALACDDAVAVVHAGHAGLERGVVGAAVEALGREGHGRVVAFIGPCIHPERYEFGAADLTRFVRRFGEACAATTREGKPALDLPAAVRVALDRAGVREVTEAGVCTAGSPDLFSHRRDGDGTGRQALLVVLEGRSAGAAGGVR